MAVAWATLGVLTATLFGTLFYLGSKIDALSARMDGFAGRMDAMSARLDAHVDRHAG